MRTWGYIASPARMCVLVLGAALFAACAYGVDPDRSGLEPGAGGASGGVGPGGATSSSADAVSSSANSTSASSTSASSTSASSTSASSTSASSTSASSSSASTGAGGSPPAVLHLQYKAAGVNATDNQIKPHFNIVNGGTTPVGVAELSIRYYYTLETNGSQTEEFHCDYALMGCSKVSGTFVPTTGTNADHYLELTFTGADILQPGAQTGEIQARYNKTDFSTLSQSNDYSFDPTKTAFTDWDRVTLYQNGTLIWGMEP